MAFRQLTQGSGVDSIFQLGAGYEGFYTGDMGDCVSVILLWEFDAQREIYGKMRGIHCSGGLGVLTLDDEVKTSLFVGVEDAETTLLYMIGGTISHAVSNEIMRAELLAKELPAAKTYIQNAPRAWVRQTGQLLLTEPKSLVPINVPKSSKCCVIL